MRDDGFLVVLILVIQNNEDLVRNEKQESAWLADRSDDFKLNRNRRRQRADFNRRTRGIWFVVPRKVLRVKFIVGREILFHVGEKHGDIDDVVPTGAGALDVAWSTRRTLHVSAHEGGSIRGKNCRCVLKFVGPLPLKNRVWCGARRRLMSP